MLWRPGSSCLAQGSHLSRGIEGVRERWYSLPPPTIPAGPETRTRNLWVTTPTLFALGHHCPPIQELYIYTYIHACVYIQYLIFHSVLF